MCVTERIWPHLESGSSSQAAIAAKYGGENQMNGASERAWLLAQYEEAVASERAARQLLNSLGLSDIERTAAFLRWKHAAEQAIELAARWEVATKRPFKDHSA